MYGDSDLVNRTPGMTGMHVKENPVCKMLGIEVPLFCEASFLAAIRSW